MRGIDWAIKRLLPMAVVMFVMSGCMTSVETGSDESYRLVRKLNYWEVTVSGKLDEINEAVMNGLKDLDIDAVNHADSMAALVEAKFADQTDFTIKLTPQSPRVVLMKIRVGVKGDRQRTEMLFHAIQRHFPKARFQL